MLRRNFGNLLAVTGILLLLSAPARGEESKSTNETTVTTPTTTSTASEMQHSPKSESTSPASSEVQQSPKSESTSPASSEVQQSPKSESTSPAPSALPANWVPAKIVEEKPKEKAAPAGQPAAVKLYGERKYAPAAAMFEKFVKDGTANSETHAYLAYCEYNLRHYTKALKQFDWVSKNTPDNYKLRTSAERAGAMLRGQMSGVCPQACLKPNDSRWQRVGDHREIRWTTHNGWLGVTDHHVGQIVFVKNDQIVNQGVCPTCGGTGAVKPLKDGDPVPR